LQNNNIYSDHMKIRESLLERLLLRSAQIGLIYDRIFYRFFFKFFFGDKFEFIGKGDLRIHPSTKLRVNNSKIIIENGILSIGYDDVFATKGACGIGLDNSLLCIKGNVKLLPLVSMLIKNSTLMISNGTVINGPSSIIATAGITIGAQCLIGMNSVIMDCDMHKHAQNGEMPEDIAKKIVINDHCWVGHDVTILKGVTLGEGSIVGARSVVTRDVEPHTMVAGVPARKIKDKVIWEP
jgi:acetyltransferase-like isoleucine patch superfamily enzyme